MHVQSLFQGGSQIPQVCVLQAERNPDRNKVRPTAKGSLSIVVKVTGISKALVALWSMLMGMHGTEQVVFGCSVVVPGWILGFMFVL